MLETVVEALRPATIWYWTLRQSNYDLLDPAHLQQYFEAWLLAVFDPWFDRTFPDK